MDEQTFISDQHQFIITTILNNLDLENKVILTTIEKTKSNITQELLETNKRKLGLKTFLQILQFLPLGTLCNIKDRIDMYFRILGVENPSLNEKDNNTINNQNNFNAPIELSEEDKAYISDDPVGKMYMFGTNLTPTKTNNKEDKTEKKSNIIVRKKKSKTNTEDRLTKVAPLNLNLSKKTKKS